MKIRYETQADIEPIEIVTAAAFKDAQHTSHTEQFIVRALRDAGQLSVSLVAEEADRIIGHVAASPVTISDGSTNWYGLGPVSVAPAQQRQGVGSALIQTALAELRALGAAGCVVLGEPGYYHRFGFRAQPTLALPGVPAEYFQALALAGALPAGTVSYHQAFDAQA